MADFYTRMAATALRQITDKGRQVTISRPDEGEFDPATGKYDTSTAGASGSVQAVILPLKKLEDNKYMQELVQGKLRKILVAASGAPFEPQPGDQVDDGTDIWEIFGCTPVNPAGTPILYNIKAKKV